MTTATCGVALLEVLVVALGGVSAPVAAQVGQPVDSLQTQATAAVTELEEDLGAILDELAAAGVDPATVNDLTEDRLAGVDIGSSPADGVPTRISFRVRADRRPDHTPGLLARTEVRNDWFTWRARFRRTDTAPTAFSQSLQLVHGGWRLDVGGVGLRHGFGLLVAAPGRSSSLSASQGLFGGSDGVRAWSGAADDRAVQGAAVSWRTGTWQATVLAGRAPDGAALAGTGTQRWPLLVRLARSGDQAELGLLVTSTSAESGCSLSGSGHLAGCRWRWELAAWRDVDAGVIATAWQVAGRWRPSRNVTLELAAAATPTTQGNVWGRRSSLVAGWNGHGWALRVAARPWSRVTLQALQARSSYRRTSTGQPRCDDDLTSLQARIGLSSGVTLDLRYRRDGESEHVFSERYPWQVATVAGSSSRSISVVRLTVGRAGWKLVVAGRSVGQAETATAGRRSLLSFTLRRPPVTGVGWRLAWATAWGDDIDLVTALAPLTGYVLPRHWGSWRSEILLGVTWRQAGLELQTAASVRQAQAGGELVGGPEPSFWCQLRSVW